MFIDTHTHIYLPEYDADRAEVLERAREAGASHLLLPNVDADSIAPMLALADAEPQFCLPMMGLHPTEVRADFAEVLAQMRARLDAAPARFVAVGEVGLDLYWEDTPELRAWQVDAFREQIGWAIAHDKPLVVHARNAHALLLDTLAPFAHALRGGIFHCFGGSAEEARELLEAFPRFVLGIGGIVTFKKSALPDVLANVPLTRIVLETDAPWLAPTPHRGQRNEPAYIPHIIARLADIYATTPADIEATTSATTRALFALP